MEISNNTNSYQLQAQEYKAVTLPIEPPKEPTYTNKEIYEASGGNLIRVDGELSLTPQGETNINNAKEDKVNETAQAEEAEQDAQRATATGYLAHQSQKSQVEIYLSVAINSKVELENDDTANIIETLRDVQKQNNAVAAYAAYQENQNPSKIAHF